MARDTRSVVLNLGTRGGRAEFAQLVRTADLIIESADPGTWEARGIGYEEMETKFLEHVSMRRMVTGGDVAAMVAFLLSDAGRNVSGQSIAVDANVETL